MTAFYGPSGLRRLSGRWECRAGRGFVAAEVEGGWRVLSLV